MSILLSIVINGDRCHFQTPVSISLDNPSKDINRNKMGQIHLTRGLHFIDILQQILSLVDDIKGQVIHGQGFVCMVLESLLCYRKIFSVKVIHLLRELIIPRFKV